MWQKYGALQLISVYILQVLLPRLRLGFLFNYLTQLFDQSKSLSENLYRAKW